MVPVTAAEVEAQVNDNNNNRNNMINNQNDNTRRIADTNDMNNDDTMGMHWTGLPGSAQKA